MTGQDWDALSMPVLVAAARAASIRTNASRNDLVARIAATGLTPQQVRERHGWRVRTTAATSTALDT